MSNINPNYIIFTVLMRIYDTAKNGLYYEIALDLQHYKAPAVTYLFPIIY